MLFRSDCRLKQIVGINRRQPINVTRVTGIFVIVDKKRVRKKTKVILRLFTNIFLSMLQGINNT